MVLIGLFFADNGTTPRSNLAKTAASRTLHFMMMLQLIFGAGLLFYPALLTGVAPTTPLGRMLVHQAGIASIGAWAVSRATLLYGNTDLVCANLSAFALHTAAWGLQAANGNSVMVTQDSRVEAAIWLGQAVLAAYAVFQTKQNA